MNGSTKTCHCAIVPSPAHSRNNRPPPNARTPRCHLPTPGVGLGVPEHELVCTRGKLEQRRCSISMEGDWIEGARSVRDVHCNGPPPRKTPPSPRRNVPLLAPESFTALARRVSSTGWSSVGEEAITRNTSLVAVCCSNASVRSRLRDWSSLKSRTFSIAITAWSANVLTSSICRSVNGSTMSRHTMMPPIGVSSRSSGVASSVRTPSLTGK